MDKKLRKDILEILKDYGAKIRLYILKDILKNKYNYADGGVFGNTFSDKVEHVLSVLEGDLIVKKETEKAILIGGGPDWDTYFELTAKGYEEFSSWYKKLWQFFQGPFSTTLTIINTAVSIVAIIVGWILLRK